MRAIVKFGFGLTTVLLLAGVPLRGYAQDIQPQGTAADLTQIQAVLDKDKLKIQLLGAEIQSNSQQQQALAGSADPGDQQELQELQRQYQGLYTMQQSALEEYNSLSPIPMELKVEGSAAAMPAQPVAAKPPSAPAAAAMSAPQGNPNVDYPPPTTMHYLALPGQGK